MPRISEQEFIRKNLSTESQFGFKVNQLVTYTNDYVVSFQNRKIIGFCDGCVHLSNDAFWFGVKPESLKKQ